MGSSAGKLEENYDDPLQVDFMDDDPSDNSNCSNAYCKPDDEYIEMMRDHISPTTIEWILIGAHILVFTLGLVGNFLVCVAVYRNTSMRTVTNYFIVNLAVADFMVILFCLPPTVVWDVTETWFLGDALCKIVLYFQTVSVSVSVLTLTFISVERWYAICYPLKFKATTSRAKRAIVAIWLISLTFDIPELIVLHTKPRDGLRVQTIYFTQCVPDWGGIADMTYSIFRIVLLYFLPLVFMSFAYYQIARVLWSSTNIPGENGQGRREPTLSNGNTHVQYTARLLTPLHRGTSISQGNAVDFQLRSRRKAAKMLVAVVTMFAFCYLPVHIYTILNLIMEIRQTDFVGAIVIVSHWLPYANSAINPLIYNFMSGKFRREFARAFQFCFPHPYNPAISRVYSTNLHNQKFQKEFLRTFGCWMLARRRNRRLPIRRRTPTAGCQSYSGYTGRGMSTYSRNYNPSRMETSHTQITTTIIMEK